MVYNARMEVWTINKLLEWVTGYFEEKGVDSPRLSAELLLCFVLKLERIQLYTLYDRVVEPSQLAQLRALVKRAGEQEPIAYLVGRCEFYSLPLTITPDCLIPRPETEHLVEKAILFLRQRQGPQLVLDLCTGSGCIAAAVAKNMKDVHIVATDICDAALKVAAENMEKLKLTDTVQLLCGDLFDPIIAELDKARFDLIVSNPPYVSEPEYEALFPAKQPNLVRIGTADGQTFEKYVEFPRGARGIADGQRRAHREICRPGGSRTRSGESRKHLRTDRRVRPTRQHATVLRRGEDPLIGECRR